MNRKTKDSIISGLTVASAVIVLVPSAIAAAASILAVASGLF